MTEMTAAEALAESWAGIDGKAERFRAGKTDRSLDYTDGTFPGYLAEAHEMIKRLERRGYVVVPKP